MAVKVLIIGSGAREHAIGWKISQSPQLTQLTFAPGNFGTSALGETLNISPEAIDDLADWAEAHAIDLTIVGPEAPLMAGISEAFSKRGLLLFGPASQAALMEGSKIWAKNFMTRRGIPTPPAQSFDSFRKALDYLEKQRFPLVIKADGLAQGKGVVICDTLEEAQKTLNAFMVEKTLGEAGERILVETFLQGKEISAFALCDGEKFTYLGEARDYKRAHDQDQGPNTGGMGAVSFPELIDEKLRRQINREIFAQTIQGLCQAGIPYRGILFVGLMLTQEGPKVLEYNVRFGDPETQVLLPRMEFDLLPLMVQAAQGKLLDPSASPQDDKGATVGVVIAANGYPEKYLKNLPLPDLTGESEPILWFHASTSQARGKIVNLGGRTLTAVAHGATLEIARENVYRALSRKTWPGFFYRKDIGLFQDDKILI